MIAPSFFINNCERLLSSLLLDRLSLNIRISVKYQGFTAWFDLFFILFFDADINFVSKFGSNRCQSFGGCENFLFGCSLVRWCAGAYSFGCLYHILINFSLVEERDRRAFLIFFRSCIPIEWTFAMQFLKKKT